MYCCWVGVVGILGRNVVVGGFFFLGNVVVGGVVLFLKIVMVLVLLCQASVVSLRDSRLAASSGVDHRRLYRSCKCQIFEGELKLRLCSYSP